MKLNSICSHKIVHNSFRDVVAIQPNALAVKYEERSLTYGELDKVTNRVARYLQEIGVGADCFVAVCLNRSLELVIALLSIIKAGGAYIPLDPNYPCNRLQMMLDDSQSRWLLTQNSCLNKCGLNISNTTSVFDMNEVIAKSITKSAEYIDNSSINKKHAAYMIYTSGSTGKPKGVVVEHEAITNRLEWMQDKFNLQVNDVVVQKTPYSFDVSVWEFFWPLRTGACLVLAKPDGHRDIQYLQNLIKKENVTTIHFVPSMFQLFLDQVDNTKIKSLTRVICSGEALPRNLVNTFISISEAELYNLYGPTEAAVDVSYWNCRDKSKSDSVPIGFPIANVSLYVLDSNGQLITDSSEGELHIGGVALARGYWHREDLTNQRFIYSGLPGVGRLYKTGDLVRRLEDDSLEYIGRIDNQVKIRGYRIELGELENTLNSYRGIKQSCVVVQQAGLSQKLVAFVVLDNDLLTEEIIIKRLTKDVPSFMIPAAISIINEMPTTDSGKTDRIKLQSIDISANSYIMPRNENEKIIALVWEECLKKSNIGIYDDFHRHGGNSIVAAQISYELQKRFSVSLSVIDILSSATIANLAELASTVREETCFKINPYNNDDCNRKIDFASQFQRAIWTVEYYQQFNSPSYNLVIANELKGIINEDLLNKSIIVLLKRHQILNSKFTQHNGVIKVRYNPVSENVIDAISCDQADFERIFHETIATPFNIEQDCLYRFKLLRHSNTKSTLLIVLHHMVSDGWSNGLICCELSSIYNDMIDGGQISAVANFEFNHFAQEQSKYLQGPSAKVQLDFWRNYLKDSQPLNLITDYIRPAEFKFNGQRLRCSLDGNIVLGMRKLAKHMKSSEFNIMFAIFSIVASKYSGQDDMTIGVPVANRNDSSTHHIIGCLVNTLPIRLKLPSNKSFESYVQNVRNELVTSYQNQDVPFNLIVDEMEIERDSSKNPLVQVAFVMQNYLSQPILSLNGIDAKPIPFDTGSAKFDMVFEANIDNESIEIIVEYCTDLFCKETIESFVESFRYLLDSVIDKPSQLISDLVLIQQSMPLDNLFCQQSKSDELESLITVFQNAVHALPYKNALSFNQISLTYAELDQKSNQLANFLQTEFNRQTDCGSMKGKFVALSCERSIEMIVGILAILKLGAAYVPIDPNSPADRTQYILEHCKPAIFLSSAQAQNILRITNNMHEKMVTFDLDQISLFSTHFESAVTCADDFAYVIYTSGTTGLPKGVPITHKNVIRLFSATAKEFSFDTNDVWVLFHSFAFDFSVWEIWGAFYYGAKLVVANDEEVKDTEKFISLINEHGISVLNQTPSGFDMLINLALIDRKKILTSLRYVIFGGEALNIRRLERWFDVYGDIQPILINMYGITEITVHATFRRIRIDDLNRNQFSPIGSPISDLSLYPLDSSMHLVPAGAIAELYIAGPGVASGYLYNSELTSQRFIANPYNQDHDYAVLYKTGDLVRLLANGQFEYVGRNDQQVKIRGYRIEIGAIENVIESHPSVEHAKVNVVTNHDVKSLVAYVVVAEQISDLELKKYIHEKLPVYMIPALIQFVPEIRLTNNGKVDFNAMTRSVTKIDLNQTSQEQTLNANEILLLDVWKQLLPNRVISIDDNYFKLGGDSILSIRMIWLAREIGLIIKPNYLYQYPTIRQLASVAINYQEINGIVSTIPDQSFNLTPIQSWLFEQQLSSINHWNQAVVYHIDKSCDISNLVDAIITVINHHDAFKIRYIINIGMNVEQRYSNYEANADSINIMMCTGANFEHEFEKICEKLQGEIDIEHGPLSSIAIIDGHEDGITRLVWVIHHLIVDGVSWRILSEDVNRAYNQLIGNKPIDLGHKTSSYYDWSVGLEQYSKKPELVEETTYWKAINDSIKPSGKNTQLNCYRSISKVLVSSEISESFDLVNKSTNIKIIELLLCAFLSAANKVLGHNEITFDLEGHGRESCIDVDVSRTVGWFTSIYPVKLSSPSDISNLNRNDDWSILMRSVKECIRNIKNNGIGYGVIQYLNNSFQRKQNKICFNYLGVFDSGNEIIKYTDEYPGECFALVNTWPYDLELNCSFIRSQFVIEMKYNSSVYHGKVMKQFVRTYEQSLTAIVSFCKNNPDSILSPSDFGEIGLSQDQLNKLLNKKPEFVEEF